MKRVGVMLGFVLIVVGAAVVPLVAQEIGKPAQGKAEAAQGMPPELAAALAAEQPNEHHAHLARLVGQWQARVRFYFPGQEPVESRAIVVNEMSLDGRFLVGNYKGEFMRRPVLGMQIDGYDNSKQKHTGIWIDNLSTAVNYFEGDCSDDGNVITMISHGVDPASGKPKVTKSVTTINSTSNYTYQGWEKVGDGEFVKVMEAVYNKI